MKKIKVGIVGTGFISGAHIEAIRRLGIAEVVAIVGRTVASAKKAAEQWNIPYAFGDYKEMLALPELDVIHNCTPNAMHVEVNEHAILAGKHVLSEKPLSLNSQQSEYLLSLLQNKQLVHGVNYVYRNYPLVQHMKEKIAQQEIGKIYHIHGGYLQDWLLFDTDYNWRIDTEQGGALRAAADIGSHGLDLIEYITNAKIVKVFADLVTVMPTRRKPKQASQTFGEQQADAEYESYEVSNDDCGTILFRLDNGASGSFIVSQVSAGRKNHLYLEISGSKSSFAWNQENPAQLWVGKRQDANAELLNDPLLLARDARAYSHYPGGHIEGWPDAQKNMMEQFYQDVLGKQSASRPRYATFADGHHSMKLLDAILQSATTKSWVEL